MLQSGPRYILIVSSGEKGTEVLDIVKRLPPEVRREFECQRIIFSSSSQSFSLFDSARQTTVYEYKNVLQALLEMEDPGRYAVRLRREAVEAEKKRIRSSREYVVNVYGGDASQELDKEMLRLLSLFPTGYRSKHITIVTHDTFVPGVPHKPFVQFKEDTWQLLDAVDNISKLLEQAKTLPEWRTDGMDTDEEAESLIAAL